MKKEVFNQEELDALVRRNDELNEQTLDLYGGKSETHYLHEEQSSGWVNGALACVAMILFICGVCGLVRWLLQGGLS